MEKEERERGRREGEEYKQKEENLLSLPCATKAFLCVRFVYLFVNCSNNLSDFNLFFYILII
jgi:hypothetical protein